MRFTKMHGLGNDYIYIDCIRNQEPLEIEKLAVVMSDRHCGVGGDGVVLIMRSRVADCRMRMFNADGSEGRMCGNAIRCVGKYVYDEGIVRKDEITVETLSGIKRLRLAVGDDGKVASVTVAMGIATCGFIERELKVADLVVKGTSVDVGNPHLVVPVENVMDFDLAQYGPLFENYELFPDRVNTEITEIVSERRIRMRVWERGSGETMACGTGACAVAAVYCRLGIMPYDEPLEIELRGGVLRIVVSADCQVYMTGTATRVFEGEMLW